MNKPAVIALVITLLDAMGIGLIMPVLPSLLREYLPEADVANHYGILLALYAVMQVCFAPLLGRWSDKLGRRPVLLLSLAGAAFDYTLLALSNVLWMLYLGRIISGITGATGAVAASVVADSTAVSERTAWFGRLGAAFGAGLIAGPAIGGLAGDISPHLPFVIAAILNACTFLMVFFIFKPAYRQKKNRRSRNKKAQVSALSHCLNLWRCCCLSFLPRSLSGRSRPLSGYCLRRAALPGTARRSVFHWRDSGRCMHCFRRWLPGRWQNG